MVAKSRKRGLIGINDYVKAVEVDTEEKSDTKTQMQVNLQSDDIANKQISTEPSLKTDTDVQQQPDTQTYLLAEKQATTIPETQPEPEKFLEANNKVQPTTEVKSETKIQTQSVLQQNSQFKPQEQKHSEAKIINKKFTENKLHKELKTETLQNAEQETKFEMIKDIQTKSILQPIKQLEVSSKVETQEHSYLNKKVLSEDKKTSKNEEEISEVDLLIANLRKKAREGKPPQKLEDQRKRQTYWLTDEIIKKIEELSKATNETKYEVVTIAVKHLYEKVLK